MIPQYCPYGYAGVPAVPVTVTLSGHQDTETKLRWDISTPGL